MNKHISTIFYFTLLLVSAVLPGCIKEDGGSDCPTAAHYLMVRSFDADNKEITGTGVVRDVVLYVFDNNGAYLGKITGTENTPVPLNYPEGSNIHIVGWGNSGGGNEVMPNLSAGSSVDDASVKLNNTKADNPETNVSSPDDLFWGYANVSLVTPQGATGEIRHDLSVKRKAASMNISIKGLQGWANTTDTDFSVVVHGSRNKIDFAGNNTGDPAAYKPVLNLNGNGIFTTGIFNTFPSSDIVVSIDIYKGTEKIYTVAADKDGKPFVLTDGRLLNVYIDFTGTGNVSFTVTEWGKIDINQEF